LLQCISLMVRPHSKLSGNFDKLEASHTYIQWLFPNFEVWLAYKQGYMHACMHVYLAHTYILSLLDRRVSITRHSPSSVTRHVLLHHHQPCEHGTRADMRVM
jgi:hypothetical protein